MFDCAYNDTYEFREVKMKGKKSGKTCYMVIIDQDEQNMPQSNTLPSQNIFHNEILIHVENRVCQMRQVTMDEQQSNSVKSMANQKTRIVQEIKVARKSTAKIVTTTQRPNTRSTKCKSQYYYEQKNQATIPEILNPLEIQYKKMLIKKCVSLRNRQYIIVQ